MAFLAGQRVTAAAISLAVNPPIFQGYLAGVQSIPNNAFTAVNIDTEVIDTHGGHNPASNPQRYVAQVAGVYELTGVVVFPASGTGTRGAAFGYNSLSVAITGSEFLIAPAPGFATTITAVSVHVQMAVGDYVTLLAFQNTGSAVNTSSVGAAMNSLAARWVSN